MFILVISWVLLGIIGLKIKDRGIDEALSAVQCAYMKGICAVEILIGHIGFVTSDPALFLNRKAGVLFVGIFFFLSGYGLMFSRESKPEYMKGLFLKKAAAILGPSYLVYAVYKIFSMCVSSNINYLYDLFNPLCFFHANNWFVWEIILFYFVFSVLYKMKNITLANGMLITLSLLFIATGFIIKLENPWYGSTLCFSAGVLFFQYRKQLSRLMFRYWKRFLTVGTMFVLVFTLLFFVLGNESVLGNPVARNLAAVFFCIATVTGLHKVCIGNRLTNVLGKCSYEIYLVHPYVLVELRSRIEEPVVYAASAVGMTIMLAYVVFVGRKTVGKVLAYKMEG